MDINLPGAAQGTEVAGWFRDDDDLKSIPIAAVTVRAMKGHEEQIRDTGLLDAYMAKPILLGRFLAMIDRFLDPTGDAA